MFLSLQACGTLSAAGQHSTTTADSHYDFSKKAGLSQAVFLLDLYDRIRDNFEEISQADVITRGYKPKTFLSFVPDVRLHALSFLAYFQALILLNIVNLTIAPLQCMLFNDCMFSGIYSLKC